MTTTETKFDIFNADATAQKLASEVINAILADEGTRETINPAQVLGMGYCRGSCPVAYVMTAVKRFNACVEFSQKARFVKADVRVYDGNTCETVRKSVRIKTPEKNLATH
jgi:hypothetical protein